MSRYFSRHSVPFAAAFVLVVAASAAAQETAPATVPATAPASAPATDPATFTAAGKLASIPELKKFADEYSDAKWIFDKAAKVTNLELDKHGCKWVLDGHIFVKQPVRGITSEAVFFGKGRFTVTPPIAMEKQQVKRFLGTESVDRTAKRIDLTFTGADDQQIFDALSYTAADAATARETEAVDEWIKDIEKQMAITQLDVDEERRRLNEFFTAVTLYERLLDPAKEGALTTNMHLDVPEDVDTSRSHLIKLQLEYEPEDVIEFTLAGQFNHGKHKPWSLIGQWHVPEQYEGKPDLRRAGSSPYIEKERKDRFGLELNKLRMTFDPGGKADLKMHSEMDIVVLSDNQKGIFFYVAPFMGTTKAIVEGKEVEFFHPVVPGATHLHSPFIILPLSRAYAKGEKIKVTLELEGKMLENLDGSTWAVREEDAWYPNPGSGLGGVPTRFDSTLIVPKGFTAVANGLESPCDPAEVVPGSECFHFATNTGIDFATFNIGRNVKVDRGEAKDGTPIAVYTNTVAKRTFTWRDEDNPALLHKREYSLSETGEALVQKARLSHAVYEEWFGNNPYNSLMLTPHPKGHGRGSASLLLLAQFAFLSQTNQAELAAVRGVPRQAWRSDAFVAHEIAHQWWGGAARIRGGSDQWFSEGFAEYGAILVLENIDTVTKSNYKRGEMAQFFDYLLRDDAYPSSLVPVALGNRLMSAENRRGYEGYRQNYMYSKGGVIMHMLRGLARAYKGDPKEGDVLFKKAMHDFINDCAGKKAPSNTDLENSLEKTYGFELDWFFNQWVYDTGIPKLEWSYQMNKKADGNYLQGRVKQRDTTFQFPLTVTLHEKGNKGDPQMFYQMIKKKDDMFEVGPIPFVPEKVTINDDFGVLAIVKDVAWSGAGATAAGQ